MFKRPYVSLKKIVSERGRLNMGRGLIHQGVYVRGFYGIIFERFCVVWETLQPCKHVS